MSPAPSPVPLDEVFVSRRCKAKSSRTGKDCGRWASVGMTVCTSHGARSPRARAAAARRVTTAKALKTAKLYGRPDIGVDPVQVLTREIADQAGTVRALRELLDGLDADAVLSGPGAGVASMHSNLQARLMTICATAIKLQVESRSQVLAEQLTLGVAHLVRELVTKLDLSPEQQQLAKEISAAALLSLTKPRRAEIE